MQAGILGSGTVGQHLAVGLRKSGYDVCLGTRNPEKLRDWAGEAGTGVRIGSFADAAAHGELLFLATGWAGTENAIQLADPGNFAGKILVDVTNPLHFPTPGAPPEPALAYPESAGKHIQSLLPECRVVKCFNSITAAYMANPVLTEGTPDMFLAGNDAEANQQVARLGEQWGWRIHDMGGIEQSYLLEALAMLWIRYGFLNQHWTHAFKLLMK